MGWQAKFARNASGREATASAVRALSRDAPRDTTSLRCIPRNLHCSGRIIAKSSFALCGVAEANAVFKSRKVTVKWRYAEGERVEKGSAVSFISGNCRAVLACERTALNYLMLLSGIATKSRMASKKYGKWKIAATRKTLPCLSDSEKRAVAAGGCLTHRLSLADGILVKDNHIAAIMKERGCRREEAVSAAVSSFPHGSFVEVEVSSASEALAAAKAGAKAVLADNVSPAGLRGIAKAVRRINRRIVIEASGGITLKNAGAYLRAGADFVSTSELTMKVEPADLSLELD